MYVSSILENDELNDGLKWPSGYEIAVVISGLLPVQLGVD